MLVVVAVIIILVGLIVPAATSLWNERKNAQALNTVQGLLLTTRARALQTAGTTDATVAYIDENRPPADRLQHAPLRQTGEVGFFAYLDDAGVQRFAPIQSATPPADVVDPHKRLAWQNVFVVTDGPDHALPAPMRVVPREAILDPADPNNKSQCPDSSRCFSDEELANDDFTNPPRQIDQAQRHRNFFTIVFSPDGQLAVRRDVIIQDKNEDEEEEKTAGLDFRGDRTGLIVGPGKDAVTESHYTGEADKTAIIDRSARLPGASKTPFPFLIVEPRDPAKALNSPSVDGLLVYDDSLFRAAQTPAEKRRVLRDTARPLYVSRLTGQIVRGPVGENVTP